MVEDADLHLAVREFDNEFPTIQAADELLVEWRVGLEQFGFVFEQRKFIIDVADSEDGVLFGRIGLCDDFGYVDGVVFLLIVREEPVAVDAAYDGTNRALEPIRLENSVDQLDFAIKETENADYANGVGVRGDFSLR